MGRYFWSGQSTTGISKFDWNTPANWKVVEFVTSGTGQSGFGYQYVTSSYSPGAGDQAYFGVAAGEGSLINPPTVLSPCLFGGYSGNAAAGSWLNMQGITFGGTANSSLVSVMADLLRTPAGNKYPFGFWGNGISGSHILNYLSVVEGISGVENDTALASYASSAGMAARSRNPVKLKTDSYVHFTTDPDKLVVINGVKSLIDIPGSTGSTAGTSRVVQTQIKLSGSGSIFVNGGVYSDILDNQSDGSIFVSGVTCGSLVTSSSANLVVDRNCRFSRVNVAGYYPYKYPVQFGGSLHTPSVLAELGLVGVATTGSAQGPYDSSISITPVNQWWINQNLTPSFVFGMQGASGNVPSYAKTIFVASGYGTSGSSLNRWNLVFGGGVSAQSIELDDATLKAQSNIQTNVFANIGTVFMDKGSIIDLSAAPNFNNWNFGSVSGNSIDGGIIFEDDASKVFGSAGVRLFNTQVILGNRVDKRNNKVTQVPTPSTGFDSLG